MKKSRSPSRNFACNQASMIAALAKNMSAQDKRAFAGTLNLHEPAMLLTPKTDGATSTREAYAEEISMMALLMRIGDQDLIAGAIGGESFLADPPFVRGSRHEFKWLGWTVMAEGLCEANATAIKLAIEALINKSEQQLHLFYQNLSEAQNCLATHADSNSEQDVRECAELLVDLEASQADGLSSGWLAKPKASSPQAVGNRIRSASQLLGKACRHGSSSLAEAALAMGAQAGFKRAQEAVEAQAPKLAQSLMERMGGQWAAGKEACHVDFFIALEKLGRGLIDCREKPSAFEKEMADSEMLNDFASLLIEALERSSKPWSSREGSAQGRALAQAMALSKEFEDCEKWRGRARAAFPAPHPTEIVALAQAGQWELCQQRLLDAEEQGAGRLWGANLAAELCFRAERRSQDEELWLYELGLELESKGFADLDSLAKKIAARLTAKGSSPMKLAQSRADWEARSLGEATALHNKASSTMRL